MIVDLQDAPTPLPAGFDELVRACAAADDHAPFGEHTLLLLHGHRQVGHARLACTEAGRLVGYAVLSEGLDGWYVELAVRPDARGRGAGVALLQAAAGHVASHGGGVLRGWAHGVERAEPPRGWRTGRTLHVLHRSLTTPVPSPDVPPGLRLRDLDPRQDADRDAWLRLSNAAFAGHPENGGWTRRELDWRMAASWTDGSRFPVVEDGGRLVAGVWTKREAHGPGELYVVAVDPQAQGRGLGRLVVAAALQRLRDAGCATALLYVDADNAPARRLYDGAGFVLHHVDRCHELLVPAAAPVA